MKTVGRQGWIWDFRFVPRRDSGGVWKGTERGTVGGYEDSVGTGVGTVSAQWWGP